MIFWRRLCTVKSTISRLKEDGNQIWESLQAEQSKSQQLEEKIKILAQDRAILQSEKIHLEQQAKTMQQDLDSKDLFQASGSTTQQTSGSEHHDTDSEVKLKSPRLQIQEMEQEHKRTEALLKTEITFHEKQAQEHMMNTQKAEYALAAERKETANLRQKESIKKMECDQACMRSEKNHQESLNMILEERLDILHKLCQQKDNALQQKLAQEEVERCVKDIKPDGPKKEIRNLRKRIQEINEINDDTQSALNTQGIVNEVLTQETIAEAVEERNLYLRKLQAEEKKTKSLEENVQALKEDLKALEKETFNFQIEVNSCNGKLHDMTELCQRKDKALLQTAAQIDYERREKVLKVKDVLRSYKQKAKTMEEQHQKAELSYKAEIDHLKKMVDNLVNHRKACSPEHTLAERKKDIRNVQRRLDQASSKRAVLQAEAYFQTLSVPTPGCSHWETPPADNGVATQTFFG
ncbi:hypothetical protein AAFF_G00085950 [Aldrovandia affinis]|uniref:Uncharacterized protein n=1 Tax=Aldrovandia affinis TaxID=143900 RepID=A0AAD7RWT5_9TELE|nr:hypothetical protein AAFF_G00085950 [Aldrovandia affinis]